MAYFCLFNNYFTISCKLKILLSADKTLVVGILLLSFLFPVRMLKAQNNIAARNTPPPNISELWPRKEQFLYSVKYGFIKIGTVKLQLLADTLYDGEKCHHIRAIIKSNPDIPFVGKKEKIFNSFMARNDTVPYTMLYWTNDVSKHEPDQEIYRLDYKKGKVYTYLKDQPKDTLPLSKPSICGPVFFFYTRLYAGTNKNISIPIYIDQKENFITMTNSTKIDDLQSKAFKSGLVSTYISQGKASFAGPFGFSGNFKAWYAADSLRIPIQASVHVWLGNVKIQLVKYLQIK